MDPTSTRGARGALLLGIDPGFASLGWALVELQLEDDAPVQLVAVGVLRTKKSARKRGTLASDDNLRRARELYAGLSALERVWRPAVVCAESMSFPRNAGAAAKMSIAWGVLAALTEARGLPLVQCSPQQLKRAVCESASASKLDVLGALTHRYPALLLKLADTPRSLWEHPVDALGAVHAALGSEVVRTLRRSGQPQEVA
jgi:crossover junction endodeoxyribonuclease RuvC